MLDFNLNWLAVLVAGIGHMVVGSLWYGPIFGNTWMKAVGKTRDQLGNPIVPMITSMVMALVMTFGCAVILANIANLTLVTGVLVGLIIGVCFVLASALTSNAFDGNNKMLPLLFGGYQIVAMVLVSLVLTLWR